MHYWYWPFRNYNSQELEDFFFFANRKIYRVLTQTHRSNEYAQKLRVICFFFFKLHESEKKNHCMTAVAHSARTHTHAKPFHTNRHSRFVFHLICTRRTIVKHQIRWLCFFFFCLLFIYMDMDHAIMPHHASKILFFVGRLVLRFHVILEIYLLSSKYIRN